MAKVVITKSASSIIVEFNEYSGVPGLEDVIARSYCDCDIVEVELDTNHVLVYMRDAHGTNSWAITWDKDYSGQEYFIVDLVDGNAPTSERDLFDKINALRG